MKIFAVALDPQVIKINTVQNCIFASVRKAMPKTHDIFWHTVLDTSYLGHCKFIHSEKMKFRKQILQ